MEDPNTAVSSSTRSTKAGHQLWVTSPAKFVSVVRRYFAKLERRRMLAMKEYNSEAPGRHGFFVDAKLVWISAPFVAFAAAALFIGGRFLSRRKGRRDDDSDGGDQGGKACTRNPSNKDRTEPRGNPPLNLAQLRALRAEAAEARLPKGSSSTAPSTASPTPLSTILVLTRKVEKMEEECSAFFSSVGSSTRLISTKQKELAQLLELLTQLQLRIDGVKGDENVRSHRKTQTTRVQSLLSVS
ncbi:hypothetical protein KC19_1G006400 [Ceratodon purpureus]|uniref:BAG domain-containing protein n=2 Tax=Ceratodon purpureus TaxID=3225 RepID=A0A8T0J127_CERPU|nr:hypothetical protein KC19_1G006400 [Ceratodon purpureus]KAG0589237.1 hypothetical protein KC19_1G006400 [Ceratodon purpureus]